MKNILLTGAILFASTTIFAQTNTFPSSGNSGIGTTSPHSLFEVRGANGSYWVPTSGTFTSLPTALSISNANPGGYDPVLLFRQADGSSTIQDAGAIGLVGRGSWATGVNTSQVSDMYFNVRNSSGGISERMRIDYSGNVGIGTTTPYSKLTVQGDVKLSDYSGSYGIYYANISETHGGQSTIIGNNIKAGTGDNTVVRYASSADNGSFINLSYSRGITFHVGVNSLLNTETDAWNYEAMRITQGGNIGIGTSAPAEKLAVNGKIRAKEIKVETSGWPDYVFQPGYKLRSLSATEQFIKTNGHLPEIPSAAVVEKEGVELGEMNKKLLQKVEELTLHLIRLEKEIKKLKTNH